MYQFRLLWIFAFIALLGGLLGLVKIDGSLAFWGTCIFVPLFLAVFAKHALGCSDLLCVCVIVVTCLLSGAGFAAFGSYYYTFVEKSQGFLVGGGWESVIGAALFGGAMSVMPGVVSLLLFTAVEWSVWCMTQPAAEEKTARTSDEVTTEKNSPAGS